MGRAARDTVECGLARARSLRLRPQGRFRPLVAAASIRRPPPLARPGEPAVSLVAVRNTRVRGSLSPADAERTGKNDGGEVRKTAAAGAPLQRPTTRTDHHGPPRAYRRTRRSDPPIRHGRLAAKTPSKGPAKTFCLSFARPWRPLRLGGYPGSHTTEGRRPGPVGTQSKRRAGPLVPN